jgi:hypothetical protein
MKLLIASLVLVGSVNVFANEHENMGKDHPCKEVKEACEAAGFKKGAHKEGKGLWMDCIQKLKEGQAVAGVTVPAEKLAACKAKKESHEEKKLEKK